MPILLVGVCGFAGACAGKVGEAPQVGATRPGEVYVEDLRFVESPVVIRAGATVTWVFHDAPIAHDVVGDDGSFASGAPQAGGAFVHTFAGTGTYTYHCSVHPYMTGSVVVTG
jgi:plastocyanin